MNDLSSLEGFLHRRADLVQTFGIRGDVDYGKQAWRVGRVGVDGLHVNFVFGDGARGKLLFE
jgi:hypothetical protein